MCVLGRIDEAGHTVGNVDAFFHVDSEETVVVCTALGLDVDDSVGSYGTVHGLLETVADDGHGLYLFRIEGNLVDLHGNVIHHIHHLTAAGGHRNSGCGPVLADVLEGADTHLSEVLPYLYTREHAGEGVADIGRRVAGQVVAADGDCRADGVAFLESGIRQDDVILVSCKEHVGNKHHGIGIHQDRSPDFDALEAFGSHFYHIAERAAHAHTALVVGGIAAEAFAHADARLRDWISLGIHDGEPYGQLSGFLCERRNGTDKQQYDE